MVNLRSASCFRRRGFRLKGKGWYETDFKSDNQRNVLKSDAEPAPSSSSSDDSKASKPATDTSVKSTDKDKPKPAAKADKS